MADFVEGAPCWVDVTVPDLAAGRRFYGELFGWTFKDSGEEYGHYTEALNDGKSVAALLPPAEGSPKTASWNLYFATADAAALADKVKAEGGQVLSGPFEVGGFGTLLVVADPGGAVFGAWQAGSRTGFELQGQQPGAFFWPEIYTRDKATVDPFFEAVLGFAGQQVSEANEFDFKIWSLPALGYPVAGRLQMNEFYPAELPAHALVYFWVADTDEAVAKVRSLGGGVTREPSDSPFGRSALVVDDQGARFALMGPVKDGAAAH
ncbi:VOC family protein [Kitasatospora camelliae]|uniref:VOC family protein n=1 Tax=Kitasatospora camelliae TaxID=3156397 RepID=A0AAU8JZG1_9ACTN